MSQLLVIPAGAFLLYLFDKQTKQVIHKEELTKDDTTSGFNRKPERLEKKCSCEHGYSPVEIIDQVGSNNFLSCNCKKTSDVIDTKDASVESNFLYNRKMAQTNPRYPNYNGHLEMINSSKKCHSIPGIVPRPVSSNNNFSPIRFTDF